MKKSKQQLKRELEIADIENKIKKIMGENYLVCNKCGNVIITKQK